MMKSLRKTELRKGGAEAFSLLSVFGYFFFLILLWFAREMECNNKERRSLYMQSKELYEPKFELWPPEMHRPYMCDRGLRHASERRRLGGRRRSEQKNQLPILRHILIIKKKKKTEFGGNTLDLLIKWRKILYRKNHSKKNYFGSTWVPKP